MFYTFACMAAASISFHVFSMQQKLRAWDAKIPSKSLKSGQFIQDMNSFGRTLIDSSIMLK